MRQPTSSDPLSQAAREDAREIQEKLDERWDRLAAGTLGDDEHDELRGLADASGVAHEAYQAFKPLGPAFQKNTVAAILRQRLDEEEAKAERAQDSRPAFQPGAPPLAAPVRRKRVLTGLFAGAMATFAATFLVLHGQQPNVSYVLHVQSFSENRGEDDGRRIYHSGERFNVEATAADRTGEIDARLFVLEAGGQLVESAALPKISRREVLFVPVVGETLLLPAGPSQLVVVLFRPGKLPTTEEIVAAVTDKRPGGRYWQVMAEDVELKDP